MQSAARLRQDVNKKRVKTVFWNETANMSFQLDSWLWNRRGELIKWISQSRRIGSVASDLLLAQVSKRDDPNTFLCFFSLSASLLLMCWTASFSAGYKYWEGVDQYCPHADNEIKSLMDEATFDTIKITPFTRKQIIYSVSGAITHGFA